jgi:glycerol-3-phosphate O-acyltransferase
MTSRAGSQAEVEPEAGLKDLLEGLDSVLVLASVASPVEGRLIDDWLRKQRRDSPHSHVEVLRLPRGEPPPDVVAAVASRLRGGEAQSVVPIRVLWRPGRLTGRSTVFAVLSGRDTYRPPRFLQQRVSRTDPSRTSIVAGEAADVVDLRRQ